VPTIAAGFQKLLPGLSGRERAILAVRRRIGYEADVRHKEAP